MRHFTVDEANEALQLVRPLAEELVGVYERASSPSSARLAFAGAAAGNGSVGCPSACMLSRRVAAAAGSRMRGLVEEIVAMGVEVKDPELGLVDFPG